ncbi:TetR/AcrR family transcriptional regulator [Pseudomonas aeruginosa]|nr:TetR/AcrR family transcriptional regulator [Pseudomonas aeruginosa]
MRYPEDHKQKTRRRIVEEAARLFRQDGVGATGLQPLMKALGLTHGGFYAHFKSKDDLVETALRHAAAQLHEITAPLAEAERPLALLIEQYLSPRHRDNPGAGCPLPPLSAELGPRGPPRPPTDSIVRKRLAMIEASLEGEDAGERAVLLLASLVGALQLSRSVQDEALSQRILEATRKKLLEQMER